MLWVTGLAMATAGVGCSTPNISKNPASLADQPVADEATELRGFQKSVALYQTGTTQGYPTRWYYMPDPENTTPFNFVADPVMMIVQTLSMPAVLFVDYPFRKVYYEGDVLPPSYTAAPPMKPERPYGPPNPDPDPISMGRAPLLPPLPPVPVERPAMIMAPKATPPAPVVVPAQPSKPAVVAPTPTPAKPAGTTTPPATRPVR